MIETINKLVRTSRQMLHEIGREPTPEELAGKAADAVGKGPQGPQNRQRSRSASKRRSATRRIHLGDFIEGQERGLPLDAAIQANLRETTTGFWPPDAARRARVLRMRFGIGMNTDHTLEEVGQRFSVTRERIRPLRRRR